MPKVNWHYIPGVVLHITHAAHKREFLMKFARDRRPGLCGFSLPSARWPRWALVLPGISAAQNRVQLAPGWAVYQDQTGAGGAASGRVAGAGAGGRGASSLSGRQGGQGADCGGGVCDAAGSWCRARQTAWYSGWIDRALALHPACGRFRRARCRDPLGWRSAICSSAPTRRRKWVGPVC